MNINKLNYVRNKILEANNLGVYATDTDLKSIGINALQIECNGEPVSVNNLSLTIENLKAKNRRVTLLGLISMVWKNNYGTVCPETGELIFLNWRGRTALREWLSVDNDFICDLEKCSADRAVELIKNKIKTINYDNKFLKYDEGSVSIYKFDLVNPSLR